MHKLLILLASLFLFAACQNSTSETNTYRGKNFSFEYPQDWQKITKESSTIIDFRSKDQNQLPDFGLNPPLPRDSDFGMGIDNYKNEEYLSKGNIKWTLKYFKEDLDFYKEINETADEKWRMVWLSSADVTDDVFDGMITYEFEDGVDLDAEAQLRQILDSFKKF